MNKDIYPKSNLAVNQSEIITAIKTNTVAVLSNSVNELFSRCDDLFFDLSSRATSNTEQNLYFESMRELRIKKAGALNNLSRSIEKNFHNLTTNQTSDKSEKVTGTDSLSLVQEDAIERDVAINSMVSKARSNHQEAIYHISTRLKYLLDNPEINQKNNPLDPELICNDFADACEIFDIHIKARIIIYKQFERLVISQIGRIYATTNDLFINAGILPTISYKHQNKTNNSSGAETSPADGKEQRSVENTDQQFLELNQLLTNIRQLNNGHIPSFTQYSSNPGPAMSNNELLIALTGLQNENHHNNETTANSLHALVDFILSKANPSKPQSVQESDEEIINLVAMFFDFILDDQNLPAHFQALISRLQIPVLKIALKDNNFFKNSAHPVRQLINTIASTAIGWESDDPENDKLYQLITEHVQYITENYHENDSIFATKLAELKKAIDKNDHRRSLIESRTKQAAEGQAITSTAKNIVQKTLLDLLKKTSLPTEISDFLIHHWQPFMILTFIKMGKDSPEWLDATQVIHDLIWSCQIQEDAKSVARLEKIKSSLIQRIQAGLEHQNSNKDDLLETCQNVLKIIEKVQNNNSELSINPISPSQAKELGHTPGGGSKNWQEMTAIERQRVQHETISFECIKAVDELPINSWINYILIDENRTIRCKLASKIETNDSYIFVNRFGFKVLERKRRDFANDLQKKRVTILENTPLFDRAFENIGNNIKKIATPN